MSQHHNIAGAVGIGLAGALVGVNVGLMLSPGNQKKLQKSMKHAVDELSELAGEIGESIRDMR